MRSCILPPEDEQLGVTFRQIIQDLFNKPTQGPSTRSDVMFRRMSIVPEPNCTDYKLLAAKDLDKLIHFMLFNAGIKPKKISQFGTSSSLPVMAVPIYEDLPSGNKIGGMILAKSTKQHTVNWFVPWTLVCSHEKEFGGFTYGLAEASDVWNDTIVITNRFHNALSVRSHHRVIFHENLPIFYWAGNCHGVRDSVPKSQKVVVWADQISPAAFRTAALLDARIIVNDKKFDRTDVVSYMRKRIVSAAVDWRVQLKASLYKLKPTKQYELLTKIDLPEAWYVGGVKTAPDYSIITVGNLQVTRSASGWLNARTGEVLCDIVPEITKVSTDGESLVYDIYLTKGRTRKEIKDYCVKDGGLETKPHLLQSLAVQHGFSVPLLHPDIANYIWYLAMRAGKPHLNHQASSATAPDIETPT